MENYCAFSKNHKCLKWTDYQLTRFELAEADETCHGNWIEIQRLYARIDVLESILKEFGITIPDETFDDLPEYISIIKGADVSQHQPLIKDPQTSPSRRTLINSF